MAPTLDTRNADADRSLRLISFGGLATAIVGSAVALTLSLGLYTPLVSAADLVVGDDAVVSTDLLNLRDDATTSSAVLTTLATDEGMTVVDGPVAADGFDWYQVVAADGTTGWVVSEYVALPTAPTFAVGDDAVVDTDALNVRDGVGVSGTVLTTLTTGDALTIAGDAVVADGYTWYAVTTSDGTTGYAVGEYLGLPVAPDLVAGDAAVVDTDALNIRDDATVVGSVLTTLVTGGTMTVLDGPVSADGYTWYQVEAADGTTGWVVGEYLAVA